MLLSLVAGGFGRWLRLHYVRANAQWTFRWPREVVRPCPKRGGRARAPPRAGRKGCASPVTGRRFSLLLSLRCAGLARGPRRSAGPTYLSSGRPATERGPYLPVVRAARGGARALPPVSGPFAYADPFRTGSSYATGSVRRAEATVLKRSIVIVMGPTPPGTGVIREAFSLMASKSTSPTRR